MPDEIKLSRRAAWSAGQPISELMSRALASPNLISLAAGFVNQSTLPVQPMQQTLAELVDDTDEMRAALQYGTTPGYPPLREILLDQTGREDELAVRPSIDQIVVTAGSNQLLHLVAECLLDPGDIVLCAVPTYLVFLGTLGNLGAGRSIGIRTDENGIVPEALEERLRHIDSAGELQRVKAIYLVSYFDNPCGIMTTADRRRRVVELAKQWSRRDKIHVIEDTAYRKLRYRGDDEPSALHFDDEGDTVVMTGSFSKSFSPGVRVGWGVLPPHLVGPVCAMKGNFDFGSPNFNQHLIAGLMQQGRLEPHVQRIRQNYQQKLDVMLSALNEFMAPLGGVNWIEPSGGLYVWVELPERIDTGPQGRLLDVALAEDVLYVPGQYCFPLEGERVRTNTMRLSFGVPSQERLRQGVQALARAVSKVME